MISFFICDPLYLRPQRENWVAIENHQRSLKVLGLAFWIGEYSNGTLSSKR